ncbi:hypothetical protein KMD31_gp52 [Staphylococcus phage P240]|uniref:Uncharacterized protein n=1 Tax=Staphylococcus phage P240 TaxID=1920379 RepID=A0A1X9IGZ0_9CAUD|nr:hypothetical protein KMD31_gp52 [Staphylococcus phage P240]APD21460.1 hypothetical protein P240_53 [Staphylococcus phage P240]
MGGVTMATQKQVDYVMSLQEQLELEAAKNIQTNKLKQ